MTNREWLNSLTDKEFAEWLCDCLYNPELSEMCQTDIFTGLNTIKMSYTDSLLGMKKWLKEEKGVMGMNKFVNAKWIPILERLPEDLTPVNITWVNRNPTSYYTQIKDKPFVATGILYKNKWFWWSVVAEDMLAEYGKSEFDEMDSYIEVIAWMPLPEPYIEKESNSMVNGVENKSELKELSNE